MRACCRWGLLSSVGGARLTSGERVAVARELHAHLKEHHAESLLLLLRLPPLLPQLLRLSLRLLPLQLLLPERGHEPYTAYNTTVATTASTSSDTGTSTTTSAATLGTAPADAPQNVVTNQLPRILLLLTQLQVLF